MTLFKKLIGEPVMASNQLMRARMHVARGGLGLLSLADRAIGVLVLYYSSHADVNKEKHILVSHSAEGCFW